MGSEVGGTKRWSKPLIDQGHLRATLLALGPEVTGPDLAKLLALVQETITTYLDDRPTESHFDFVPAEIWDDFEAVEQDCRKMFRQLVEAAQGLKRCAPSGAGLDDLLAPYRAKGQQAEMSPIESAIMGLTHMHIGHATDSTMKEIGMAIILLSKQELEPAEKPKRGRKPVGGIGAALARACYYYRQANGMDVEINFQYPDRHPSRHSKRTVGDELTPSTPTAKLAWAVVNGCGCTDDRAQVNTHLKKFIAQLDKEGERAPARSDFIEEFY